MKFEAFDTSQTYDTSSQHDYLVRCIQYGCPNTPTISYVCNLDMFQG